MSGYKGEFMLMWGPFVDIDRGGSAKKPALPFPSAMIYGSETHNKQLKGVKGTSTPYGAKRRRESDL